MVCLKGLALADVSGGADGALGWSLVAASLAEPSWEPPSLLCSVASPFPTWKVQKFPGVDERLSSSALRLVGVAREDRKEELVLAAW